MRYTRLLGLPSLWLTAAIAALLILDGFGVGQTKPVRKPMPKPDTPHLQFVQEYVRELTANEDFGTRGVKELADAKSPNEQFSSGIYVSKSAQLELRSEISMLRSMHLGGDFAVLIPALIASYQKQIELHQKLIDIAGKFVAGPRAGVDYQALSAKVPEIRAEMDDAKKLIVDISAMVFMTLIDMKPDSQDHVSHLVITKAEKTDLEDQLDILLKDKPDKGDQDFYISAAMILRDALEKKGYKCADDPWE